MNILHINTLANTGGAARAMYRLHQGLKRQGHNSRILARRRAFAEPDVHEISEIVGGRYSSLVRIIDAVGRRARGHLGIPYTHYLSTKHILQSDLFKQARIVHLHNLHGGYFNYHLLPAFSARKPIVWTLHDMWSLTSHCAYSYDCRRWQTGCFDCPLQRREDQDYEVVWPGKTYQGYHNDEEG